MKGGTGEFTVTKRLEITRLDRRSKFLITGDDERFGTARPSERVLCLAGRSHVDGRRTTVGPGGRILVAGRRRHPSLVPGDWKKNEPSAAVAGDAENKRIQTQVLKMKNPSTSRVRGWWGQNCGRGEEEEEEVGPVPRE